ncbi:hypothetical protein [Nitrospira defluvii]|uniref:Uncharacterized protein n=1 Tax=Nitrospira defluvii TaxID=330214 RepID=A0ABM8RYQ3_9BACT|nr:hypothetical protein [Nitrospira defluvii]CAE6778717.1 hypothetical protein NSPZN2_40648 [Nitrospira defluvii]
MTGSENITVSDAQTVGWELTQRTPDNQLDTWQRLFYQLAQALPANFDCARRLSAMNDVFFLLRRFPCSNVELSVPVTTEEAVRLMMPGIQLGYDNLLRLQSLLYEVANELGDHPATMPLYALWDALDSRSYELIREVTFGKEGEEGGVW